MPPVKVKQYWDRNYIALLLECSLDSVVANEARWGLFACRADLNSRSVRYHADMAYAALRERNIIRDVNGRLKP